MNTEDMNYTEIIFVNEIQGKWDAIEVHPVKQIDDDCCEQCEADEADFWSVYQHMVGGGLNCLADLPTKEKADQFAEMLMRLAKTHIHNDPFTAAPPRI